MLYPLETQTRELKSLDGIWQLCFDPERRGVDARYFEAFPSAQAIEIAVPASINEQVVERAQYLNLDWVWYRTSFRVPATWWGRRVFLRIGAATHRADVYVNGRLLCSHEGGYTPFEIEVTDVAPAGEEHQLVVRVDKPAQRHDRAARWLGSQARRRRQLARGQQPQRALGRLSVHGHPPPRRAVRDRRDPHSFAQGRDAAARGRRRDATCAALSTAPFNNCA